MFVPVISVRAIVQLSNFMHSELLAPFIKNKLKWQASD